MVHPTILVALRTTAAMPKFEEAIYVLHGFTKKTQQTSKRNINLAAKRYRELQQERTKK